MEDNDAQSEGGGARMSMLAGEESRWRESATAWEADEARLEIFLLRPGEGLGLAISVVLGFLGWIFWGCSCNAGDVGCFCSCLSAFGSTFTKERNISTALERRVGTRNTRSIYIVSP